MLRAKNTTHWRERGRLNSGDLATPDAGFNMLAAIAECLQWLGGLPCSSQRGDQRLRR